MEALKQRIAESARKAGLDSEFDALERVIKVRNSCRACQKSKLIIYSYSALRHLA